MVTPDMLRAAPDNLGRRPRVGLGSEQITGRAYGAGPYPDLEVQSDVRVGSGGFGATQPGGNRDSGGSSSFGGLRYNPEQMPGAFPNDIGGPGGAYGGGWADGVLTVRDRHVITRYGTSRNPDGGGSSMPSADRSGGGHPPPRYQMINTTESWQLGTDNTANEDNHGEHYRAPIMGGGQGKASFPLGTQDGTLALVMGPPIGEYREYGVRGPAGMHGPDPDIIDPNWVPRRGAGGGGGRGRITQQGAPGMQTSDRRTVYGGVPHGLHSPTAPPRQWTMSRQASIPQMQPPRVDRPLSSQVAGQSMSQGFPPEGSDAAMPLPRVAAQRMPGLGARFAGRS